MIHYLRKTKWDVETKGVGPLQAFTTTTFFWLLRDVLTSGGLQQEGLEELNLFLMVAEALLCSPWNCRHPSLGDNRGFREPLGCLAWRKRNRIPFFHFLSLSRRKKGDFSSFNSGWFSPRLFDAVHPFSQLPEVYVPHTAEQIRSWSECLACRLWVVINKLQLQ